MQVQVQDEGAGGVLLDCIMGVSADTVVCVEDSTRQIVLVLPTHSLLGIYFYYLWTSLVVSDPDYQDGGGGFEFCRNHYLYDEFEQQTNNLSHGCYIYLYVYLYKYVQALSSIHGHKHFFLFHLD